MPNVLCRDAAAALLLTTSYESAFTPGTPTVTFSSISRLIQLPVRVGFCPTLLILRRNECAHPGRHMPAPQQWPRVPLNVGGYWFDYGARYSATVPGWGPAASPQYWGWWGCSPAPLLMLLSLRSGPKTHIFFLQCFRAAPFWSIHRAPVPRGRRDGVTAYRRQTGNLVLWSKGSLFPHGEKAERQQLFWRRSTCGPGEYKIRRACHGILAAASGAC